MDQNNDMLGMLNLIPTPAFCVRDGVIVSANSAAIGRMVEPGTPINQLIKIGREEYSEFTEGCLYLQLEIAGVSQNASVSHVQDYHVFTLEQDDDHRELQAMALVAMELRKPLSGIMSTAEQLFPMAELNGNPETREQAAWMNRGLYQMHRVINNMSDAIVYASGSVPRKEMREICGVLDEIFARAADSIQHTGARLEYTGLSETIYTQFSTEYLERAVLNMLTNAVKFIGQDSVIRAKLTRKGKKLYLSIENSCSDNLEFPSGSVFYRYIREPALEDKRFGIGLGMVLIRCTAAAHNGTVLVDHPEDGIIRVTLSLAIESGRGNVLRSPGMQVDYTGERDHNLIELSEILPPESYTPDTF